MDTEEIQIRLKELPVNEVIKLITDVLVTENTTYQESFKLKAKIDKALSKKVHTHQSDNLKPRFDTTMLYDALSFQLETKSPPTEVFQYVQSLHQKEDDWMAEAKHSDMKKSDSTDVAKALMNDNYEVVGQVSKQGLSVKDAITRGRTPSIQIRQVGKYISISDRVDELEKKVESLDQRQTISEYRLDLIETGLDLQGIEQHLPNKLLAYKLTVDGFTPKQIASELKVNIKTVRRWLTARNKEDSAKQEGT